MATSHQSDVEKQLAELQQTFKNNIPAKLTKIDQLWDELCHAEKNKATLVDLHLIAHSLAGTSGTFGAMTISHAARELEQKLKLLLNGEEENNSLSISFSKDTQQQINSLIARVRESSENWHPTNIPYIKPAGKKEQLTGNLVYLVDDDELFSADLIAKLQQFDFRIKYFTNVNDFAAACEIEMPAAILMDMVFSESDVAGANIITKLKSKIELCPPVIYISIRDDIEVRLAAARSGACRYFCKPLNIKKLAQTLEGLIARTLITPYRILIIDDDESLLQYYSMMLRDAGMEVKTISNPLQGLEAISKFKPEIVVMDVYMPECSGLELAQVIRQDDTWAQTPIMFLSTESDLNRQLEALNLGGDDFLVKPIEAGHFVAAVSARAKRARWVSRLNKDLKNSIREGEYQHITMDQHDIVSHTDVSGRITKVNEKFCEVSGYSREELIGQNHRILKSGFHPGSFYKELWDTISKGDVWHGMICNLKKNGEEYWVESTIVPFLDDKGKPYKYVSARTDVSELKVSKERLERSQAYADIGTWDWNIRTNDLYWSDRVKQLYGYPTELKDVVYDHFVKCIHPDDREAVTNAVQACIEQGVKYDLEHRVIWSDGSIHWMLERGDVVRSETGEPLHFLGVVQDITERVDAEQRQHEVEKRFAFAVEGAGDGVWDWDMQTNVMLFSKFYMAMLGYDENELPNTVETWINSVHPDDLESVQNYLQEYLENKMPVYEVELRLQCKDKSYKWILCRGTVVKRNSEGEPLRMIGIHSDITKRKEAEQNLIDAREEADNANRAKSQFLSSMSHELRTPMNAIMGFGQLLTMESSPALSESQQENVNEIVKAGDHLLELINQVLDLAKIEAGHIELSIEAVGLGEVISESLQLIAPLAKKRGINISLMKNDKEILPEQLSEQFYAVRADRTRLRQVLLNLLSNAVKYNIDNGKIKICCQQTEDNSVYISVTDTGEGIPTEQQSQLFQAFSRLDADKTEVEGTGIGLIITKNIIELMGGKIGVVSQLGKGSTFWFELPSDSLILVQEDESADKEIKSTKESNSEHEHAVLYIEDNPANLRLVTQLLGRLSNIHMWSAHEPMLGLELAAEHKPDLILLDINLPGMNGYAVLEHLRQREATRNTPVIAISANAMPKDIQKGIDAGFDGYITKPIDVKAFLQVIKATLYNITNS